jgi:hypothetical protein
MLDKILMLSNSTAVLYFTNRPPFTVTADDGSLLMVLAELLQKPEPRYYEGEITCPIFLKVA